MQYSGISKVKQVLGGYPRVEREQFRHANKNNGRQLWLSAFVYV